MLCLAQSHTEVSPVSDHYHEKEKPGKHLATVKKKPEDTLKTWRALCPEVPRPETFMRCRGSALGCQPKPEAPKSQDKVPCQLLAFKKPTYQERVLSIS